MADNTAAAPDADGGLADAVGAVVQGNAANTAIQIRNNAQFAATTNPDQEASYQHLAKFVGAPVDSVRAQPDVAKQQMAAQSIGADDIAANNPVTAQHLANPDTMKVAIDDIANMKDLEGTTQGPGYMDSLFQQVGLQGARTYLGAKAELGDATGNGQMTQSAVTELKSLAGYEDQITPHFDTTLGKWTFNLLSGAPMTAAAIGLSVLNPALGAAAFGAQAQTSGYGKYRARGATPTQAAVGGTAEGAIAAGTSYLPFGYLTKNFGKVGAGTFITNLLARDLPMMEAQGIGNSVVDTAIANPDKTWQDWRNELPATMGESAFQALVFAGLTGAAGGKHSAAIQEHAAQTVNAQASLQGADTIQQISDLAEASKVRARNTDTFHQFMQDATQDGPIENLYLDPRTLQQSGIDPAQLAKAAPTTADSIQQAIDTGSDIKIPTADFATNIAGTDLGQQLLEHLKTDPNGMSRQEASAFMQSHAESLHAEIAKALEAKQGDDVFENSRQAVHQDILGQLNDTGRFAPDVNEAYAQLHSNFSAVMAARTGQTPEEFHQKYGSKIVAEDLASPESQNDFLMRHTQEMRQAAKDGILAQNEQIGAEPDAFDQSIPHPDTFDLPDAPTKDAMDKFSRVENVPLDKVTSDQGKREWDKFNAGEHPGELIQGYGDKPVAVKFSDGSYLLKDGNHRTELALDNGDAAMDMHVIDAKDYAPGRDRNPPNTKGEMSNEDLLKELGFSQAARGAYVPETRTIAMFKSADLSTFLHESGHFFLDTLNRVTLSGEAPEELKGDMDATLKWMGVKGEEFPDRLVNWNLMSVDQQRDMHEQFARGFENYLISGKSPSVEMQGVFQRFRSWLLNVYRKILAAAHGNSDAAFRVDMNSEIRGVFDRMLASADQIKDMEAIRQMEPIFRTAEDAAKAGMSPEQFKAYHDLGVEATQDAMDNLQARSMRDMRYASGAHDRALKALQAEVSEKRRAVKAEVTQEVMNEPVNRAKTFFKRGEINGEKVEGSHRLDVDAVSKMEHVPVDKLEGKFGKYGLLGKDGLDPDIAAEMFGYKSGTEMLEDMIYAESPRDKIAGLTDQRMLERYGDLTSPAALSRAADDAIHNDVRAKFVATEASALSEAAGGKKILTKAARSIATDMVNKIKIRDLRPDQYATAAARAARNAEKARAGDDIPTAAKEKRNQLIQTLASKAATDAQEAIQKGLTYLDKFDRKSVRENIGNEYIAQIDALLDRFDLRKGQTLKAIDRKTSLVDWMADQQSKGYDPAIDPRLLDEAQRVHFRNMSVEAFKGLIDGVKSIEHLGRLKQKLLDLKDMRDFNAVVADAQKAFDALPKLAVPTERNPGVGGSGSDGVRAQLMKIKSSLKSGDASLLKIEQMCDWLDKNDSNGVFNRIIFRRMGEAQGRENDMQLAVNGKLREAFNEMPDDVKQDLNTRYSLPELIDSKTGEPSSMLKKEILSMALNTANESNYDKMLRGEGWSDDNVRAVLERTMKPGDIEFVNKVLETVESLWPEIEAMEKRLSGVAPPKIEGRPYELGAGTIKGGYYPLVYDPNRSYDVDQRSERKGDSLFENNYQRATTDSGYTKARDDGYARPLKLSLDVIPSHLSQVIHDLSYREAVIDADRFIGDKRIRAGIEGALGKEYYKQFKPWLQSIANDRVIDVKGLHFWDSVAHNARTSATMVGIGYRISTMLVHGATAASNSLGELGPKWMSVGVKAFFGSPEKMAATRDFVFERSPEMKHRMNELDRDIRDSLRELDLQSSTGIEGGAKNTINVVKKFAFQGVAMLDMGSALPTWVGAYQKGIEKAERGGMGLSEDDAAYYADKAVRNAHGAGGAKDLSAIQRGSDAQKLFTMFYSFWNHFYNRQRDLGRRIAALPDTFKSDPTKGVQDMGSVMARSFFYFVAPQLIHGLLKPSPQEESNPFMWAIEEMGLGMLSGIPVARDVAAAMFTGKDYSATPAESVVNNLLRSWKDVKGAITGDGASDKWVNHTINNAGYVFGLPLGQAATSGQFLWDVMNGDQAPDSIGDWYNGIVHGKTKQD